jgi:hypothetical protein
VDSGREAGNGVEGRKHFFSEEKKQKTFISALVPTARNKSFLVPAGRAPFFKKELLPFLGKQNAD